MPEKSTQKTNNEIYIVDGQRTPFLKAKGKPGPFSATDLAVAAGRDLLARLPIAPTDLSEVILGCVGPREDEANIARLVALRLGCGKGMPAYTVQRNCGSGMQALDSAIKDIQLGRADLVLAGGTEAMSRAPLVFRDNMVNWLADLNRARTIGAKLSQFTKFRPKFLSPIISLIPGLTDPIVGMIMGKTAENLAYEFGITRTDMDEYACRSHKRAEKGHVNGLFKRNLSVLYDAKGNFYDRDTGVRGDTTIEKLEQLKPVFDKKFGMVTPGNSAQVTDGAAVLILASKDAVKKYKLPVMGKIIDANWAALEPEVMGLGPVYAATPLMQRNNVTLNDIDYWEINEAFAAQVIGCLRAWQDESFCKNKLGLAKAFGKIDEEKLNVDGGAVALGHPVGASGARIVLRLLNVMERNDAHRGVAAICIGGGQGGAMLIER